MKQWDNNCHPWELVLIQDRQFIYGSSNRDFLDKTLGTERGNFQIEKKGRKKKLRKW